MISNFSRYRDIVLYRTWAELKAESQQNYLGYVWFLLQPMITTAILYVVFGVLWSNRGGEYVVFLLTGMVVWQWFESCINSGMGAIKAKLHIRKEIPLPKYLFPLVHIFADTWRFLFVFVVLIGFASIFKFYPNWNYFYLPLLIVIHLTFIIGIALILSVASAYLNDLTTIVQSMLRILFFISGIFFSIDKIPAELIPWFLANPAAAMIHNYRSVIIDNTAPSLYLMGYILALGLTLCCIGFYICKHFDQKITKDISL